MSQDLVTMTESIKGQVSAAEWQMQVDLATCYRLIT